MRWSSGKRTGRGDGGFTLLEILVAVVILGMAYLVVMQNFSTSLQNIVRLESTSARVMAGQLELDRYLVVGEDEGEPEGEVFVEGNTYQVLQVRSQEDDRLVTLVVRKQ